MNIASMGKTPSLKQLNLFPQHKLSANASPGRLLTRAEQRPETKADGEELPSKARSSEALSKKRSPASRRTQRRTGSPNQPHEFVVEDAFPNPYFDRSSIVIRCKRREVPETREGLLKKAFRLKPGARVAPLKEPLRSKSVGQEREDGGGDVGNASMRAYRAYGSLIGGAKLHLPVIKKSNPLRFLSVEGGGLAPSFGSEQRRLCRVSRSVSDLQVPEWIRGGDSPTLQ